MYFIEEFIIAVYCCVEDELQAIDPSSPIRGQGFEPGPACAFEQKPMVSAESFVLQGFQNVFNGVIHNTDALRFRDTFLAVNLGVPLAFATKNNAKAESQTTIDVRYFSAWLCSREKLLDESGFQIPRFGLVLCTGSRSATQ